MPWTMCGSPTGPKPWGGRGARAGDPSPGSEGHSPASIGILPASIAIFPASTAFNSRTYRDLYLMTTGHLLPEAVVATGTREDNQIMTAEAPPVLTQPSPTLSHAPIA